MGISRPVRLMKSACVEVPTVIGWLSPVVLIPVGAFMGLSPDQLRDILVHELAHIKRHDYLVNLIQVVAETLLFFHPAVSWVSRIIREERENCCDDAVVVMNEDRLAYAKALVRLEELRHSRPGLAVRADGGTLLSRIRRLTGGDDMKSYNGRPLLTGVLLALLLVAGGATLSLAIDRPGMGKNEKSAGTTETVASYAEAEKDFEIEGRWEITRYGEAALLQVRVRERKNRMSMSISFDEDQFIGLDYGDDDEFVLVRDAGTFYFAGDIEKKGKKLEGDGKFGFVPNDEFEDEVGGNLDDHELLILAAHDVGFRYIHEMEKLGYQIDDGDDLVPLAIHGVSLDYVRELRDSGYELSLDALVRFRIHGVDPDYVHEMAELGYDHVPAEELVRFRIHGVGPEYIQEMQKAGVGHMSTHDLTRMRIHGVSPEYVRKLNELGYTGVDVDDLVRMRIHGVTSSYIEKVLDKTKEPPSIDTLIKMKIHGIYL